MLKAALCKIAEGQFKWYFTKLTKKVGMSMPVDGQVYRVCSFKEACNIFKELDCIHTEVCVFRMELHNTSTKMLQKWHQKEQKITILRSLFETWNAATAPVFFGSHCGWKFMLWLQSRSWNLWFDTWCYQPAGGTLLALEARGEGAV